MKMLLRLIASVEVEATIATAKVAKVAKVVKVAKVATIVIMIAKMMMILYGLQYIISLYQRLCWRNATIH
jgi:hypothetical protein